MPATRTLTRQHADEATLALPFAIPAKEWFSPIESARVLGLSERFIEKLYDEGRQLSGHSHNAGSGQRMTKRIPRIWLVTYAIRTARYSDESLGDALITCLPHLSAAALLRIADASRRLAADKPFRS